MKPAYEVVPVSFGHSFVIKQIDRPNRPRLSQAWHYHPEIEICYTFESNGKRFVGNQISDYESEDLVMFGSNLPHGFTTDERCRQVVIQITDDFLGKGFINIPELRDLKAFFEYSKHGLEFDKETIRNVKPLIKDIIQSEGLSQLISLLRLLKYLSETADAKVICPNLPSDELSISNLERIRIVYDYIMENFNTDIKVSTVADMINLSEAGFYKFFKKHANKNFTRVINEFRINHAGNLLQDSSKTIAQVAFESGYNNISHFNRTFKKIMGKKPKEFRDAYNDRKVQEG